MISMKNKLFAILALALLAGSHRTAADDVRLFRVSGPASTAITVLRPNGVLVWSNALPGETYTLQTASSGSAGGINWTDYVQTTTTSELNTNQLIDFNPPAGMAPCSARHLWVAHFSLSSIAGYSLREQRDRRLCHSDQDLHHER